MHLKIEQISQVLYWTLHHPEQGNALGTSLASELDEALAALEGPCADWRRKPYQAKLAQRVLVVQTSPSGKKRPIWIAGGNLKELSKLAGKDEGRRYAEKMSKICLRLMQLPIPVIMAIHGEAIGGGAEFALAGDLRIASRASGFDFKQLLVGLAAGYGTTRRLSQLIGLSRSSQLLLQHQRISAETAKEWGLINQLVDDVQGLHAEVRQTAENFCRIEPLAVACQKEMLHAATQLGAQEAQAQELELFSLLWMNPSHKKYLKKFCDPNDHG